jgi:hypothetical protein
MPQSLWLFGGPPYSVQGQEVYDNALGYSVTCKIPFVSLVLMDRVNVRFSPQQIYFAQVLGLTHVIRPHLLSKSFSVAGSVSPSWRIEGNPDSASIIVYIPEPMSGEIQELFTRIMTALFSNQVLYLRGSGSEADLRSLLENIRIPSGLIFGRQWADQFGIEHARLGAEVNYAERRWRKTYSLSEMLGTGSEVAERKKQAWGHMRNLI